MSAKVDALVVGAGFAGAVAAEQLASSGKTVLVIDKRLHIAGNAYDRLDSSGVLIHEYGPHIFHTNSEKVSEYLSRFTDWRPYEHRVLASVEGKYYPIPINRTTVNRLYDLNLDEAGVKAYLDAVRFSRSPVLTSEDSVLNAVGSDLCERFFRGYTRKQWGLDLSALDSTVAARIPVRFDDDDRYFTDTFQKMPSDGYSQMFARILEHKNIRIELGVEYAEIRGKTSPTMTIYTGPIDEFYSYRFGRLPYRSLRFDHVHYANRERYQPVGTVNYPNEQEYTRITEFKHLTGQVHSGTSIVKEFPSDSGDPYYPIPNAKTRKIFLQYAVLAEGEKSVRFVGRLAQYRYFNMDQVCAAALKVAAEVNGK